MAAEEKTNSIVEDYIAKTREEINSLKKKQKEALLESIGLYTDEREYSPTGFYSRDYPHCDNTDENYRYYRITEKQYPEIDDDTFEDLQNVLREKKELTSKMPVNQKTAPLEFDVDSKYPPCNSFAARFMKIVAWILWIGGLILAIFSALVEKPVSVYRVETVFEWQTFISVSTLYFVTGSFAMCMSELFNNIATIASRVAGYTIKEIKK